MTSFSRLFYYTSSNKKETRERLEGQSRLLIYLDIILLLNLLFNLMLLSLTKYLARVHTTKNRLLFGTMIATALVPIIIYFPNSFLNTMIGKGMYSIIIILCTFGWKGIQQVIKNVFVFYFISFAVGGGLFGLHYLVQGAFTHQTNNNNFLLYVKNVYGDEMSLLIIVIGFPLIWLFTKTRMDRHVKDKIKYDQLYKVSLTINGHSQQTMGFIDSGNQLVDPLTNRPVVICDELFLQQFFSKNDWYLLRTAILENEMTNFPISIQKQISIVPYQGVGGSNDYLYTIRPDKLTVMYGDDVIETDNVLIGIQIAHLTIDHSYHCLLHPEIVYFNTVRTA